MAGKRELPHGWLTVRFDQMAESITDRVDDPSEAGVEHYVGLEHLDPESLKIRRWGEPGDVSATKLLFQPGDIIFGRRRAYQRKLAVAEFEGICSAHALVLRAREDVVEKAFMPFFMQSEVFFERALAISVGSLSPTINWKTLAKQEFAIPPKDKQRRIAEVLWEVDAYKNAASDCLSGLETLKRSALSELFGGIGHARAPHVTTSNAPSGWKVQPLGEVVEFLDHRRIPLSRKDRAKRPGPFPYFGASGIIDHVDDYLFDEPLILLGEDGANLLDRNSPLAFKVTGKIWVNNHAHVLRPLPGFNIDFYAEYLESISFEPYVTGTAQPKLNKGNCERIPVPVPPADEQERVAAVLAKFERQKASWADQVSNTGDLYRGLLHQLFTGRRDDVY